MKNAPRFSRLAAIFMLLALCSLMLCCALWTQQPAEVAQQWERALTAQVPAEYAQPWECQTKDTAIAAIAPGNGMTIEVIGKIQKPDDLIEKVKPFLPGTRREWMNSHAYSLAQFERIITQLPSEYPIRAFRFRVNKTLRGKPTVIISCAEHGNELSSVAAGVWLIHRLQNGDLAFTRRYFSEIVIIPDYSPYGSSLGLRIGVNGTDPTYHNPWYSKETKKLFLEKLPENTREQLKNIPVKGADPEEAVFRRLIERFPTPLIILSLHEQRKNEKIVLLTGGSKPLVQKITGGWLQMINRFGYPPVENAEDFPGTEPFTPGVLHSDVLTPETTGLDYHLSITIETGAVDFQKRVSQLHQSIITLLKSLAVENLNQ